MVLTCSALKKAYRDRLREADPDLFFVHLSGSRELLSSRLGARQGHFMPASLLDSQLAALEAPQVPAERCLTVDIASPPEVLCATVATFLQGA
jgi:carbohydrate kinase (thermoresistant glucokinase family)